jgi:hypothetical protein
LQVIPAVNSKISKGVKGERDGGEREKGENPKAEDAGTRCQSKGKEF